MKLRTVLLVFFVTLFLKGDLIFSGDYKMVNGNVLVICVDSLRADHLGCYGYDRDTSPCIDKVANDGVLFTNAISQAPWTKPSVASLFTSMYMSVHNVLYGYRDTKDYAISCRMSNDIVTIAEILKIHGYATAGFGQKLHLRKEFGFKQGFDLLKMGLGKSSNINNNVISWLHKRQPDKFFLYIHYDDAHFPYTPQDKFKMYDVYKSNANVTGENFKSIRNGEIKLSKEDINHIIASYDGEIKCVDEKIGLLLKQLDGMGYGNNTLVIILADHGDEFMEHGGVAHGHTLYEELIRVPLIMKGPSIPKKTQISGLAQCIDIAPTILDILDLQPDKEMEGRSLVPLILRGEEVQDAVYSERKNYNGEFLRVIRTKKWKLIKDFDTKQTLLFDLENDPGEITNVRDRYPKITADLELRLSEWLNREKARVNKTQFKGTIRIDEATKERLKSLGYAN
ncbi:MAG: sulfatase [Candidatus Brocadia sp.]